jgi:DNA polymerase-3 subunit gamma/tau
MKNYVVSARKYRPHSFEEVVGQQHVTNTLLNAIESNHLAQALLFTGPRGVGKTTCARILAKFINADSVEDENHDFSYNIFELDAASNNGVEDIRSLVDQVRYAPQIGKYKVYIIDEVHMLSSGAFNAFLKTLEEPPKHAIFILATTEKHKIIPTILSRCQIYDFKRIELDDIVEHLKTVAEKENITTEEKGLRVIAQKADGALRDALSIFDRLASFNNQQITYEAVIENLRILDYEYYFKTVELALAQNNAGLFNLFSEILENGFDGHLYINGLASHLRDLLVSTNTETVALLEADPETQKRYLEQSQKTTANFLLPALKILSEADVRYKNSNNPRLLVELALLELAHLADPEAGAKKKSLR